MTRPALGRWKRCAGPEGLRRWTNDDLVPRPGDVFQERLYCIRWIRCGRQTAATPRPMQHDLAREAKVLELLRERFAEWQREGFIPSKAILKRLQHRAANSRARLDPLASSLHAAAVVDAWIVGRAVAETGSQHRSIKCRVLA